MRIVCLTALLLCALVPAKSQVSLTPNIGLQVPGYNQTNWQVPIDYDLNRLDLFLSGNLALPALNVTGTFTAGSFVLPPLSPSPAGTFGSSTQCVTVTVNSSGQVTAISQTACVGGMGGGITALTGDVTASGTGSVVATLATVNGNVGTFGSSTACPSFTVNAKGLITAASQSSTCPGGSSTVITGTVYSETPMGAVNGTNPSFSLTNSPNPTGALLLYRNGVLQKAGADYSLSGTAITFVSASIPATGDSLFAWYVYGAGGGTANIVGGLGTTVSGTSTVMINVNEAITSTTLSSYTIPSTAQDGLVTYNNASASNTLLAQAGAGGIWATGTWVDLQNKGAGTLTVSATTSTINGNSTLTIAQNRGCRLVSDGTNWQVAACSALVSSTTGGASIASTTNIINGDGAGNGLNSGIAVNQVVPLINAALAVSGAGNNGIQNAVAAAGSAQVSIWAPASYGTAELDPCVIGNIGAIQTTNGCTYTMGRNIAVHDIRTGDYEINADSYGLNGANSNYYNFRRLDSYWTQPFSYDITQHDYQNGVADLVNLIAMNGGINIDTGVNGTTGFYNNKSFYIARDTRMSSETPGQHIANQSLNYCYSLGDCLAFYGINYCYGGYSAGADEGCEGEDVQSTQGTVEYTNTIQSESGNTIILSTIVQNPSLFGDGTQGAGRYLVDITLGAANTVTTMSCPGTSPCVFTLGTNVTATTYSRTSTTAITTPSSTPQNMSVNDSTGLTTGETVCVADQYSLEQVVLTAGGGGVIQGIFRYPHPVGAFVNYGGLSCHLLALTADTATNAQFPGMSFQLQNNLHWMVPIISSTTTSATMWLQSPGSNAGKWPGYIGRWNGTSNNVATIYPGAQVTSVMQGQQLSGTFTLEVPVTWSAGDTVALPQYHNLNVFAALLAAQRVFPSISGSNAGALYLQLAGMWGQTDTAISVYNNTPANLYAGAGGVLTQPRLIAPGGTSGFYCYLCIDNITPFTVVLNSASSDYMLEYEQNADYMRIEQSAHLVRFGNYVNYGSVTIDRANGFLFSSAPYTSLGSAGENSDGAGKVTLASGTYQYNFTGTYAFPPVCTANDNTTAAAIKVVTTTSSLTVSTAGSSTDVVSYTCTGKL